MDALFKSIVLLFLAVYMWAQVDTRIDGVLQFAAEHGWVRPGPISDLIVVGVILSAAYIVISIVKGVRNVFKD